jgi:hypothetical protein
MKWFNTYSLYGVFVENATKINICKALKEKSYDG